MTRTFKVALQAGAHSWTVTDDTPPGFGLTDQLTIGWVLPDGDHRPSQPDPMVASFGVVVATADDLDDLGLGNPVSIAVTFGPADKPEPDVTFWGRIAQGEAAPHPRGMLYRFTCADASTDLAGYDLAVLPYPPLPVGSRQSQMLTRAGLNEGQLVRDPVAAAVDPNLHVEGIPQPAAANLLTAMIDLWSWVALAGAGAAAAVNHRAIVAPHPFLGSGPPDRWGLDAIPDAYVESATAKLPGRFGNHYPPPGPFGVWFLEDDRAAGVIDACVVDFDSQWTAVQGSIVNRAVVTWLVAAGLDAAAFPRAGGSASVAETPPTGQPVVTTTRTTQLLDVTGTPATTAALAANFYRLAAMVIPPPQNPGGWAPGAFRWLLWADPAGQAAFPLVFPRHEFTNDTAAGREKRGACYVRPVVVAGIPGKWNAADAGRDWIAGQLTRVTLTIQDGKPVIDFELAPTLPDSVPGFTWNDTGLTSSVKWDTLHPQTWDTYRLVRASP